jgi:hypothetical protein
MWSGPKLYNESLFVASEIRLDNWNWEFRSCRSTEQKSEENWVESSKLEAAGNGKKGIRLCQEDVICEFKWQTVINPLPRYD